VADELFGVSAENETGLFGEAVDAEPEQTVIGSIARGAGAGLVSIPQGIAELGAAGIDLAADTELSRNTTEFFEDLKDKLGFTPERTAGRIAETLVNYGAIAIPCGRLAWEQRRRQQGPRSFGQAAPPSREPCAAVGLQLRSALILVKRC
jgi:hypothetical protein